MEVEDPLMATNTPWRHNLFLGNRRVFPKREVSTGINSTVWY